MTTINDSDKDFANALSFLLLTAVFIVLARDLSVLCHEWAHGVVAWIYGYQHNPLTLHLASWSLLHTYSVDSGSLYANLFILGQKYISAKIAIAGPATNLILMILGALLISVKNIRAKPWFSYFLFWVTLNNFGQVYAYIPEHLFTKTGDIAFFLDAYMISPWTLLIPIVFILLFVAAKVLIPALSGILVDLKCEQVWLKGVVLLFAIALVFFWYGFAAQDYYGFHNFSGLSYPLSVVAGVAIYFALMRSPRYLNT